MTAHDDAGAAPCCDLSAITASERPAHIALVRRLFAESSAVHESDDAVVFELPADRISDVGTFIQNERRCCRHLAFGVELAAGSERLLLRVVGAGARQELRGLIGA